MSTSTTTTTESRALDLLGKGIPPSAVASALGVDPSRITQLLSDQVFALQVVEKKFESLSKHASRDLAIDQLEDHLLAKLKDTLPFMTRPMEILKSFSVINAAKRRTLSHSPEVTNQQTIVTLNIPSIIIQKFTQDVNNQVVSVGEQSLVTMQSSSLLATAAPGSTPAPRIPNQPTQTIQDVQPIQSAPTKPRPLSAYEYKKQSQQPPIQVKEIQNVERTETGPPIGESGQDVGARQDESQAPTRTNARLVASFASN